MIIMADYAVETYSDIAVYFGVILEKLILCNFCISCVFVYDCVSFQLQLSL